MNLIIALVDPIPQGYFVNLLIVSSRKTCNSQSLDSCNQNPTYGISMSSIINTLHRFFFYIGDSSFLNSPPPPPPPRTIVFLLYTNVHALATTYVHVCIYRQQSTSILKARVPEQTPCTCICLLAAAFTKNLPPF